MGEKALILRELLTVATGDGLYNLYEDEQNLTEDI